MQSVGLKEVDWEGLADGDPNLMRYFQQVRRYPLLTYAEEQKLGQTIRRAAKFLDGSERKAQVEAEMTRIRELLNGELSLEERRRLEQEYQQWCWRLMPFEREEVRRRRAINALCRANFRFVIWLAKQLPKYGIPFSDRIQYGNEGLYRAAERFDPERKLKFVSYAGWWVRQAITRHGPEDCFAVHRPEYLRRREPMDFASEISLEVIEGEWQARRSKEPGPEEVIVEADARAKCRAELELKFKMLSPREIFVVRARSGFDGPARTLEWIGLELAISRERVRQIQKVAMAKLRQAYGV